MRFSTRCRKSTKILGLANAFSGGLFMGIALFHLLPESVENFNIYFSKDGENSRWKNLPCASFLAFISYSLILLVEKVAFDSHSLTEHDHGDHHAVHHSHDDENHNNADHSLNPKLSEALIDYDQKLNLIECEKERIVEKNLLNSNEEILQDNHSNFEIDQTEGLRPTDMNKKLSVKKLKVSTAKMRNYSMNENGIEKQDSFNDKQKRRSKTFGNIKFKYAHHPHHPHHHEFANLSRKTEKGYEEEEDDIGSNRSDEFDEDQEEQTMKNVVSSKGKFASYLHARNISIYYI
jgi:hypothetical protein